MPEGRGVLCKATRQLRAGAWAQRYFPLHQNLACCFPAEDFFLYWRRLCPPPSSHLPILFFDLLAEIDPSHDIC